MKKRFFTLFAFASVVLLMVSCDKLQPKYNVDRMVEDFVLYQEEGDAEKCQKLLNKLVELNKQGQVTDAHYYMIADYLTDEELALFDEAD